MKKVKHYLGIMINILCYPVMLLILTPIDYTLWREYKKQGYNVQNINSEI